MTHPQAFLATQFALTGLPLFIFIAFTITVFVFSVVAALLVGVLVALLFTAFMVGVGLLVVLPTIFVTTAAASFLFLWGLGGYYILKWFNEDEGAPPDGKSIGEKLNSWTGGRMNWIMDGTNKKEDGPSPQPGKDGGREAKREAGGEKKSGHSGEGNFADPQKHFSDGKDTVVKNVDGVQKRVNKSTGAVTNTAGTAKGTVSGVTGLG